MPGAFFEAVTVGETLDDAQKPRTKKRLLEGRVRSRSSAVCWCGAAAQWKTFEIAVITSNSNEFPRNV